MDTRHAAGLGNRAQTPGLSTDLDRLEWLLDIGAVAEIMPVLHEAAVRTPHDPATNYLLARAALAIDNGRLASTLLKAAGNGANTRLRLKIEWARAELHRRQKRNAQALAEFESIARRGHFTDKAIAGKALFGMARLHVEAGRPELAHRALEKAATLYPNDPEIGVGLAEFRAAAGDAAGALAALTAIGSLPVSNSSASALLLVRIGAVFQRLAHSEDAERYYRAALQADPDDDEASTRLASLVLRRPGGTAEAAELLNRVLSRHPDDATARHFLAAATGGTPPERASDSYVRQVFDSAAAHFDEKLLGELKYGGPALLSNALARTYGPGAGGFDILDAGCGTGLCGPILRPYAATLAGIDLSPGMLDRARARGVYDTLAETEITRYLADRRHAYDIVSAADVLVYFGDVRPLLQATAGALRAGGRFFCTVERLDPSAAAAARTAGFALNATGRFSHTRDYLLETAAAAGLRINLCEDAVIRHEGGSPVAGYALMIEKPSA